MARTRGFLAQAVYGFFANGGSRCYITRLDLTRPTTGEAVDHALQQLTTVPEISILAAPDVWTLYPPTTDTDPSEKYKGGNLALQKIAQHCADQGTRVAVLDPPPALSPDQAKTWHDSLTLTSQARQYATVYYPWITTSTLTPTPATIPSCGHIAGVWAHTDSARGVHKAPANQALNAVTAPERPLSDTDQGPLNQAGVNCLRAFPGEGTVVWGARTLSDTDDWRYLNVRRYVSFIRDSLQQATNWAVFEPNDERLWAALRRTIAAFLTDQWRTGALQGETAADAFYVVCDDTNNTPDSIRDGVVRCDIGVAIVRPAEFVEFTLTQIIEQPS
ncbi:phage tail sheath family protein [Nocardia terpenica]|uniref:phage tail sheath family protein n=1 Tax=Nocardia terpenica TaxID=455432 RepID=UPI001EEC59EF|nr:phage tail sheath subtilisin-like domain-containing protein [Nocardia terpenica]